jgi:hypothetical protein
MTATVPVQFEDGEFSAVGTVTFRIGEPTSVDGQLQAPLFVNVENLKVTRMPDQDKDS